MEQKFGLPAGSARGAEATPNTDIVPSLEKPAEAGYEAPQPERTEKVAKYTPANTEGVETHRLSQQNLDSLAGHSANIRAMQDLGDRLGVNLASKNVNTSLYAEKVAAVVDAAKAGKAGPNVSSPKN